ncbi:MAG TPA: tetratricopeptide repeat protein [Pyrinomonadaceae bacterium]|nr:tetratricopeptide repeat protein [Pyrinomonadaceae bacterium]
MKITSSQIEASHLPANEEALIRCRRALELKDKDDYEGIREVMRPLWGRVGDRPEIGGLHVLVSAEVLLCVGILTGWLGNKEGIGQAQEVAKNLITESITSYQAAGDKKQVAAARIELAICYWREGGLDEARIMFNESLQDLTTEGNTRARALLRLAILEWSASRYSEAHRILHENVSLFRKITNFALKANYHNQLAMVLRELAIQEGRNDYLQRAIREYQEADELGKLAHNLVFRANVKNNVGNVLRQVSRHKEAHKYLEEARRLMVRLKDKVGMAQTDDTRAQVFIAEKKFSKAEAFARGAVSKLEKSGRQCLLADALITHGIALARMGQPERAQSVLERAMDVAHQVGALNKAGLAALTLIEELDQAATEVLCTAFDGASEWLADSDSDDLLRRISKAARKLFVRMHGDFESEDAMEALRNTPPDLHSQVLNYERTLIRHALARANGRVTRAASLLSVSYQGLAYIIGSRHHDLLKERTPVRPRGRRDTP